MTAPAPDRRARRARREGRQGTAVLIASVILGVVALGCAGAALVVHRDTNHVQEQAEPLHEEVRALTATEVHAERRLRQLTARRRTTTDALAALFAAEQAQVDASNHAVDVANQAVDQYNNAQAADVAAAFAAAGDAALTDLDAKTQAVRTATAAAQRAVTSLLEASDG